MRAGAHPLDPGRGEVLERVEQGFLPVVEGVVVGERHAVDPEMRERPHRCRRSPEEERLVGPGPLGYTIGDAALEVQHEQVGPPGRLDHVRVYQGLGRRDTQSLGDASPQHRVARQGQGERVTRRRRRLA